MLFSVDMETRTNRNSTTARCPPGRSMLTLNSNLSNGLKLTEEVWEVMMEKKRLGAHIASFLGYPPVSETKMGGNDFPLVLY